ncbi:hypothetical protein QQP08_016575 [Theobroma cacao]|nr:hypothetical protein QQP08_016575 [Theobroma cacao]
MRGHLSQDTVVEVPAAVLWDVFRSLQLAKLVDELLGDVVGKVEVVQAYTTQGVQIQNSKVYILFIVYQNMTSTFSPKFYSIVV